MSISKKDYGGYVVEVYDLRLDGSKELYLSDEFISYEDAFDFANNLARGHYEVIVRAFYGSAVIWAGGLSYV